MSESRHPGALRAFQARCLAWARRWSHHSAEPHILFPALAVLILGVIWGTTLNLVTVERIAAQDGASDAIRESAATYEAQALRALHEIDQTLKIVKYAADLKGSAGVLPDLRANALLPPDLLFAVGIADANGDVVAGTRASLKGNIASRDYFVGQRLADAFVVGSPRRRVDTGEWTMQFSRRLATADGRFNGIVFMSVDAAYFVSAYEPEKLGAHGLLGLLGTDGVFRARRSGDEVSAGGSVVDVARFVAASDGVVASTDVALDGISRFTKAIKLFDLPLVVVVGLSRDEQFATANRKAMTYLGRAVGGSVVVVALLLLLGRMSRQLAEGRKRAVAEQALHAERVEHLAYHDALTALPNRSMFSRLLVQSIAHAKRHERRLAVLFLDLDRFKQINDTLGHDAGDQLLKEVAVRLGTCLRTSDTVARLGGDEFVALLPELDDHRYAATVALKILAVLATPFVVSGHDVRVTASIGISTYPTDGLDESTLTKNADIAMYSAKAEGKNNFQFYSARLSPPTLERLDLECALRQALERQELFIEYRPRCDSDSGRITAMETVLRWQHPARGAIDSPDFMPVAEETGLGVAIGDWMLTTVCAQQMAWQREGLPPLVVAIRLTERQLFDDHFLGRLAAILGASGMRPSLLELAIGEQQLMPDVRKTMQSLVGLRDLGVRIAIDDFGVGYAALATLKRFPIDTIKIHRSMARNIARNGDARELAEALVAMGRTLSRNVRTPDATDDRRDDLPPAEGCDGLRTFFLDQPVAANGVPHRLLNAPPRLASEPNPT